MGGEFWTQRQLSQTLIQRLTPPTRTHVIIVVNRRIDGPPTPSSSVSGGSYRRRAAAPNGLHVLQAAQTAQRNGGSVGIALRHHIVPAFTSLGEIA